MDDPSWLYIAVALLSFAAMALLPGALVASIVCSFKGWSKSRYWSSCAKTNMIMAWFPATLLMLAPEETMILLPFILIGGIVWVMLNQRFLKLLNAEKNEIPTTRAREK
jgi:hypothetical protein